MIDNQIDINCLFLLENYDRGIDLIKEDTPPRIAAWRQTLLRKQLIKEEDNTLTPIGKALLSSIEAGRDEVKPAKRAKKSQNKTLFDVWWETYPRTDNFVHNGRTFKGIQSKRIKEALCKSHFNALIDEGISGEDIIAGTKYHIELAKELSVKTGENKIHFIPNSERYLREKCFQSYIGMAKTTEKIKKPTGGAIDI